MLQKSLKLSRKRKNIYFLPGIDVELWFIQGESQSRCHRSPEVIV